MKQRKPAWAQSHHSKPRRVNGKRERTVARARKQGVSARHGGVIA